jgi:hypothetical protein
VIIPDAAINGRHPVRHASAAPSANSLKRMGDEFSVPAATATSGATGVPAIPAVDEIASARHPDASLLDNKRDIPSPCQRGTGAMRRIFWQHPLLRTANHLHQGE